MRLVFGITLLALVGCGGGSPCKPFCQMDCQNTVTCANGQPPSGSTLDSCVNGCDDAYQKAGVTDSSQCDCGGPNQPSCSSSPGVQFIASFKC